MRHIACMGEIRRHWSLRTEENSLEIKGELLAKLFDYQFPMTDSISVRWLG
jgi:hypothetical protein